MKKIMGLFNAAIALSTVIAATPALAGVTQTAWDFEQRASSNNGVSGWFFTRGAGLDNGKGLAYRGQGNAWIRNTTGWNATNNWVSVSAPPGSECTASAWLRTSDTLTDGYMSVRDGNRPDGSGTILNEIKLVGARPPGSGNTNGYRLESFNFRMGSFGKVLFYVGLWGIGKDAWIQIDDAAITCGTPVAPSSSPSIAVQSKGDGSFVVSGSNFLPNTTVHIRVVDAAYSTVWFNQTSTPQGTMQFPTGKICQLPGQLFFSANDGRSNSHDLTGTLWSNTVTVGCPY